MECTSCALHLQQTYTVAHQLFSMLDKTQFERYGVFTYLRTCVVVTSSWIASKNDLGITAV